MPIVLKGISDFEKSIPDDPCIRTFAGLERSSDGAFDDDELVKILKEGIEDPAGMWTTT